MAMKLIKKTADYKIFVRGDERYAVQDSSGKPVNGEEKVRILVEEELIKVTVPAPKEEAPEAEEAASDEVAEATVDDTEDAPAEDNTAEPEPEPEPEAPAEESEPAAEDSAASEEGEEEEAK